MSRSSVGPDMIDIDCKTCVIRGKTTDWIAQRIGQSIKEGALSQCVTKYLVEYQHYTEVGIMNRHSRAGASARSALGSNQSLPSIRNTPPAAPLIREDNP